MTYEQKFTNLQYKQAKHKQKLEIQRFRLLQDQVLWVRLLGRNFQENSSF